MANFNKARGFMQGFEQGLYNLRTFKLDAQCLGYASAMEVEDLYVEMTKGGIGLFRTMNDMYQLQFMINKYCLFDDVFHDLLAYCSKGTCSFALISQNMLANFFKITASANDLAQTFKENAVTQDTTPEEIFGKNELVGKDIGTVIRAVINFDQTKL